MAQILAIAGSPRKMGSSDSLMSIFLKEFEGARLNLISKRVCDLKISGCLGCRFCEKNGYCRIEDEMEEVYQLLRYSDLIVISSSVFFYGFPSQLKALIDRSQSLWARAHRFNLSDPKRAFRKGFVIAVGATRGKNLFLGIELTSKYFFEAVGARFDGILGLREVEDPRDIEKFPEFLNDVRLRAREYRKNLEERKKILFLCRENACRSQMAEAFMQIESGGKFDIMSAGDMPKGSIDPKAYEIMAELGIDLKYRRPKSLEEVSELGPFDLVVTMGCETGCPHTLSKRVIEWNIDDPAQKPLEDFRKVRDEIREKVKRLVEEFS